MDGSHLAAICIVPVNRDFDDFHATLLGQEQDLDIEAPSTDRLEWEKLTSRVASEALKASLGILNAVHRQQAQLTRELLTAAEAAGRERLAANHRKVLINLDKITASLEALRPPQADSDG